MPSEPTRLHPATLLFTLTSAVRRHLIPAIVILYWGTHNWGVAIGAIALGIAAMAYSAARYISLRYCLTETELIVTEGILKRNERHIPFERIHNIDTSRTIIHRIFGVTDVSIQTASGSKPEAVLQVLSLEAVEAMRRHVFAHRESAPGEVGEETRAAAMTEPEKGTEVTRLGVKELMLFGIISNRGMIAVAALLGILTQVDILPQIEEVEAFVESLLGITEWGLGLTIALVTLGILGAIALLRLLSIGWAILTLYNFTLTRASDELRTRYGLLTQRTATIPRHRIQLVKVEATLLHRLFKRAAIRARTAGSSATEEAGRSHDWLLPLSRRDDLAGVIRHTHPTLDLDRVEWHRVSPRAVRRLRIRTTALFALPALIIGAWFVHYGLVAAAIAMPSLLITAAMLAWGLASLEYQNMAYGVSDDALWFRSGWLTRTLKVVRFNKIQTVVMSESPFDRRHRHATVKIDTANAGAAGHPIAIPYLPSDIARHLYVRLSTAAGQTAFKW